MVKVSVIIPVYNIEKYLRQCLDSVVNQTLKDIEIICVDDGSTDGSFDILQEYAEKDVRIKVVKQKNKGSGAARNKGLEFAQGEFVIFFDSDDFMSNNMLEQLYNRTCETNSEITLCRSEYFHQIDLTTSPIGFSIEKNIINDCILIQPEKLSKYIFQFCVGWPWDKLYKKDFIINNKLQFQNLRQSNDTYFVLLSLVLTNSISIVDEILVTHRTHKNSLEKTRRQSPECFYYALMELYKALLDRNLFKTYEQSFINYCFTFSFWHMSSIDCKRAKNKMFKKFKKLYKKLNLKKYSENYFYDIESYKFLKNEIKYNSFPKNIFSIRNSNDKRHKIITILGLKLKIKRDR